MIVFSGQAGKQVLRHATRIRFVIELISVIFANALLDVLFIPLLWQVAHFLIFGPIAFNVAVLLVIVFSRRDKIVREDDIPKAVYIKDGKIIASFADAVPGDPDDYRAEVYEIENVESVVDYGSYYVIKNPRYIFCQKDLLTQGTLEDFEKLFADKIVRKVKKTKK